MIFMSRRYELRRRAEQQEETRQRIVEAAVRLHGSVGLTATTVTRIAELAGVGRQTVYRHFPDELTLVKACSGHYWDENPFPDLEPWRAVADPDERLRLGLREAYAYHRRTEPMLSRVYAEAKDSPIMQGYHDHWRQGAEVIVSAWDVGDRERSLLRAAIGHAIVYPTWHSLVREQGLGDAEAVELMHRLTCECRGGE